MSTESNLRDWRDGQTNAERLCAAILAIDGYSEIDPQAPLGGPDGRKDILAERSGARVVAAVFFPATRQAFASIRRKYAEDREGVARHDADRFVFMVNQSLTLGERQELKDLGDRYDTIYHLERLRHVLDSPPGYGLRLQYLRQPMTAEDQIAFFSTLNADLMQRFLAKDRLTEVDSEEHAPQPADDRTGASYPTPDDVSALGDVSAPMSRLSISTLILLHRSAMAGTPMSAAVRGQLRTVQTWLSDGSEKPLYIPPEPEHIPAQLIEALTWWQRTYPKLVGAPEDQVVSALARLCHEIIAILPFIDGNMRLAAALVDLAAVELLGRGIDTELLARADPYLRPLQFTRDGDLTKLATLIGSALV